MSKLLHLERAAVIVGTVLMAACTGPTPDRPPAVNRDSPGPAPVIQKPQSPEEQRETMSRARAEEAANVKTLAAAMQADARNDAWASQKEQELKTSYASSGHPRGALKSVECRSTKCEVLLEVGARDMPNSPAGPIAAFNQWIAATQPCGYTIVAGEAAALGPGAIRIVIDCAQPSPKID